MANNLEEEILDNINVGDEIILEPLDSNVALDSRIMERIRVGKRVNAERRFHGRKVQRRKREYLRNDVPRLYHVARAILREVISGVDYGIEEVVERDSLYDDIMRYWNPRENSTLRGYPLSEDDKARLELLSQQFLPIAYKDDVYFVSMNLLEEYAGELPKNPANSEELRHSLDELALHHPEIEVVSQPKRLKNSNVDVNVIYKKSAGLERVPREEQQHTTLLAANSYESLGNGYGSRFDDGYIKGFDELFDHLPLPDEIGFKVEQDDEKVLRREERALEGLIERKSRQLHS